MSRPNFLNRLLGKSLRQAERKGKILQNRADTYTAWDKHIAKPKRWKKLENDLLQAENTYLKRKQETFNARAGTALAGGAAAGTAIGTYKYKKDTDDLKKNIGNVAKSYYLRGVRDATKTASLGRILTGGNIRSALKSRKNANEALTRTIGKGGDSHDRANKAYDLANKALWIEGGKTLGTYGALGLTGKKLTDLTKEAGTAWRVPAVMGAIGTVSGGAAAFLTPELDTNKKNIAEGAAIGAATGTGLGLASLALSKNPKALQALQAKLKQMKTKQASASSAYQKVQNELGANISDKKEKVVNRMMGQERAKSFVLRNSYLTGIPTMGIAPAIAESRAKKRVIKSLARKHVE